MAVDATLEYFLYSYTMSVLRYPNGQLHNILMKRLVMLVLPTEAKYQDNFAFLSWTNRHIQYAIYKCNFFSAEPDIISQAATAMAD